MQQRQQISPKMAKFDYFKSYVDLTVKARNDIVIYST